MNKTCCVPGCWKRKLLHQFPILDKKSFNIWKERVAHKKFAKLDDQKIFRIYSVCNSHFSDDCKIPDSGQLKKYSLPTINMPGFKGECNNSFSYPEEHKPEYDTHEQNEYVNSDHNYVSFHKQSSLNNNTENRGTCNDAHGTDKPICTSRYTSLSMGIKKKRKVPKKVRFAKKILIKEYVPKQWLKTRGKPVYFIADKGTDTEILSLSIDVPSFV